MDIRPMGHQHHEHRGTLRLGNARQPPQTRLPGPPECLVRLKRTEKSDLQCFLASFSLAIAVGHGARRCHERVAWARLTGPRSTSKLTRHLPGTAEDGQSRARHSLISSSHTSTSTGVYHGSLSSQRDPRGRSCTVIRNPEKRKVGSSC